jgi:hypothetical protein
MVRKAGKDLGAGRGGLRIYDLPLHGHAFGDVDGITTIGNGVIFDEDFSNSNSISGWTVHQGSGERAISTDSNSGGSALQVGNNSGDDEVLMTYDRSFVLDPTKLYKVTVVAKTTAGTGTASFGVAGRNKADTAFIDKDGNATLTLQHHFTADGVTVPATYTLYEGYFKAKSASGNGLYHPNPDDPGTMDEDAYFYRPLIRVNASGVAGTTFIDHMTIAEVDQRLETKLTIEDGITLNSGYLTDVGGNIELDFTNQRVWVNNETITNAGVQMGLYSSAYQFYAGDGSDKYFYFDGTDVTTGPDTTITGVMCWNSTSKIYIHGGFSDPGYTSVLTGGATAAPFTRRAILLSPASNAVSTAKVEHIDLSVSVSKNTAKFNIGLLDFRARVAFSILQTGAGNGTDYAMVGLGSGDLFGVAGTDDAIGVAFRITTAGTKQWQFFHKQSGTYYADSSWTTYTTSNNMYFEVDCVTTSSYTIKLYAVTNTQVGSTVTVSTNLPTNDGGLVFINTSVNSTNVTGLFRAVAGTDFLILGK